MQMAEVLQIRQEGTPSTGRLLFIDIEENGVELTYELDSTTGEILDEPSGTELTTEIQQLLAGAFEYFRTFGPSIW